MGVTYKGQQIGGSGNPSPAVGIDVKSNVDEVKGRVLSKVVTWTISGVLLAKSGSTIQKQALDLKNLFDKPVGNESWFTTDAGEITLDGRLAACIGGLHIDPPSFPDGSNVQWGTKLNYVIRATGTFWEDSGISQWANYKVSYSTDERLVESRSMSGSYFNKISSDLKGSCENFILSKWSLDEKYSRSQSVQLDSSDDGTKKFCSFTVTDRGLFKVLPTGVSSATIQKTIERGSGGEGFLNINASFVGKDKSIAAAKAAADIALQPYAGQKQVSYSETEDEYNGVFSVNVKYLNTTNTTVSEDETISIRDSIQDFALKPVLGGRPIKQNTVIRPASASQSGSKVSIFAGVSPNNPRWAEHLKSSTITYSTPTLGVGLLTKLLYKVSWDYQFESVSNFNFNGY